MMSLLTQPDSPHTSHPTLHIYSSQSFIAKICFKLQLYKLDSLWNEFIWLSFLNHVLFESGDILINEQFLDW